MASLFFFTSCGAVGLVSTPSSYPSAGKEVSLTKKNTNILVFKPMDAQKEPGKLLKELEGKCTNGVTNVRTTVSVSFFILGFEKIEMTGNCN